MPVYKYGKVWAFKINIGKKQIFRSGFKSKHEAQMAEYAFRLKLDEEQDDNDLIKLSVLNQEFKHYIDSEYKLTTAYNYNLNFNKHVLPFFNDSTIEDISNLNVISFMNYLKRIKYQNKEFLVNILKIYLDYLKMYLANEINYDLLRLPKKIKSDERTIEFYTLEEFSKFDNVIIDHVEKLLFNLLFYYGIRISELRGLKHKDFNLKLNKVFIRRSLSNKLESGKRTVLSTKSKSSDREYPLLKVIKDLYLKAYSKKLKEEFLFDIGETTIARRNVMYARDAGLKRIRLHDFRHSCASFLINNGMDYLQVSAWLGHKSPVMTLETYSHLFPSRKQAIAQFIDDL